MPFPSRVTSKARPRAGVTKSTMPAMPNSCSTSAVRFNENISGACTAGPNKPSQAPDMQSRNPASLLVQS